MKTFRKSQIHSDTYGRRVGEKKIGEEESQTTCSSKKVPVRFMGNPGAKVAH